MFFTSADLARGLLLCGLDALLAAVGMVGVSVTWASVPLAIMAILGLSGASFLAALILWRAALTAIARTNDSILAIVMAWWVR